LSVGKNTKIYEKKKKAPPLKTPVLLRKNNDAVKWEDILPEKGKERKRKKGGLDPLAPQTLGYPTRRNTDPGKKNQKKLKINRGKKRNSPRLLEGRGPLVRRQFGSEKRQLGDPYHWKG